MKAQQEKAEDYGLATDAWDMGLRRVSDSAGDLNGLVFSVLAVAAITGAIFGLHTFTPVLASAF